MFPLLKPEAWDLWEVGLRSYLEARNLLSNFRFDQVCVRQKGEKWSEGQMDNSWKPDHQLVAKHLDKLSNSSSELGEHWSMFSALSHPTIYAAEQSVFGMRHWGMPKQKSDI